MLHNQIHLGVPSIWIHTQDTQRMIDTILLYRKRSFYTIVNDAFSKYENGTWKPVLFEIPNPDGPQAEPPTVQITSSNISLIKQYLQNNTDRAKSTWILNSIKNADEIILLIGNEVSSLHAQYRQAIVSDNIDSMPYQIIVVSPFACPENYNFLFIPIKEAYPSFEELVLLATHIYDSTNGESINSSDIKNTAKAGLGLNEFNFINLCLLSALENGKVDPEYIYKAKMSNIKANGILEIIKPKMTFDMIGGLDLIKRTIIQNVYFWQNPEEAHKFDISPIRRILTVGIPGTGKSAICEATANALGLDLARTGVSQVMNSFVGRSEANMRAVFQQIHAMAPLCVWIDEFGRDLSGGASSSHVDGGTTDRVHGEFLTGLQELPNDVFLMCAANQLDNLRPEMIRADRFDKVFFVGLPAFEERIEIIKIYLPNDGYNYEAIAHATKYFTGAEIKSLIKQVKFNVASEHHRAASTEDIIAFAPNMRNILWNKDRDMIRALYRTAYEQWDWSSSLQLNDINDILNNKPSATSPWELKV